MGAATVYCQIKLGYSDPLTLFESKYKRASILQKQDNGLLRLNTTLPYWKI